MAWRRRPDGYTGEAILAARHVLASTLKPYWGSASYTPPRWGRARDQTGRLSRGGISRTLGGSPQPDDGDGPAVSSAAAGGGLRDDVNSAPRRGDVEGVGPAPTCWAKLDRLDSPATAAR